MNEDLPIIICSLSRQGVCKVSLEAGHACAVTIDGRAFLWGRNDYNQVTFDSKVTQLVPKLFVSNIDERVLDVACASTSTTILTNKTNVTYLGKLTESHQQTIYHKFMTGSVATWSVQPFNLLSSSNEYCLFNLMGEREDSVNQFIAKEQLMLEEMITVDRLVMKVLSKKSLEVENTALCESLCLTYKQLLQFMAVCVESLLEYRCGVVPLTGTTLIKHWKEFTALYKHYIGIVLDLVSVNGFDQLNCLITISPQLYTLRSGVLKELLVKDKELMYLVQSPVKRLLVYNEFYRKFASNDLHLKWKEFMDLVEVKTREADRTSLFWETSGKTVNYLKLPKRRLISDSPINLHNSSRFSNHRFLLFSDVFVHITNSTHRAYDLKMIWLDLPQHDSLHLISMKTPEETLILITPDGESKWYWFQALQQAIKIALNKPDLLQPPMARKGSHVYSKTGLFKDALYTGRWFNGNMHGTGKCEWPDGRTYTGQFVHNCMTGYGVMYVPNVGQYILMI